MIETCYNCGHGKVVHENNKCTYLSMDEKGKFSYDCKCNDFIDEVKIKLMMYVIYHYEDKPVVEKDLLDAFKKDAWFKMSIKEINDRYGKKIDKNIKKMERGLKNG
jgi:hypothetical protein